MMQKHLSCLRSCKKGDLITVYETLDGRLSNVETPHKKTYEVIDMRFFESNYVPSGHYPMVWPSNMYYSPVCVVDTKIFKIKKYR